MQQNENVQDGRDNDQNAGFNDGQNMGQEQ